MSRRFQNADGAVGPSKKCSVSMRDNRRRADHKNVAPNASGVSASTSPAAKIQLIPPSVARPSRSKASTGSDTTKIVITVRIIFAGQGNNFQTSSGRRRKDGHHTPHHSGGQNATCQSCRRRCDGVETRATCMASANGTSSESSTTMARCGIEATQNRLAIQNRNHNTAYAPNPASSRTATGNGASTV